MYVCMCFVVSDSEGCTQYSSCMCVLLFPTVRAVHSTAHVCVFCCFRQ